MGKVIAIDSELLVLLVVGVTDRTYISKHGRLRAYTASDFDLLLSIIEGADEIVFTPHTLAEASNHLEQKIKEPCRSQIMERFRKLMGDVREINVISHEAASRSEFLRLGLTDAVVLSLGQEGIAVLTVDLALYLAATTAGYEAVNFNHLRDPFP